MSGLDTRVLATGALAEMARRGEVRSLCGLYRNPLRSRKRAGSLFIPSGMASSAVIVPHASRSMVCAVAPRALKREPLACRRCAGG